MDIQIINQLLSDMNCKNVTFIIGAGASMKSGICTGTELAYKWLEHLINMAGNPQDDRFLKLKSEIDAGRLRELKLRELNELFDMPTMIGLLSSDFDSNCTWNMILKILCGGVGKNYFRIAGYLSKLHPELIQSSIFEAMQGKVASSGYRILAQIMQTRSNYSSRNIVITTNFDDLLQQALYKNFVTGHMIPVIVQHKSLAHQISLMNVSVQPIIFKVHHDFLFEPLNTVYDVMYYSEDVKTALGKLISNRLLLVLGYSGANDNLMEYIIHYDQQLKIYWGFYDSPPNSEKFKELYASHHQVIPFEAGDFDKFMDYIAPSLQIVSMLNSTGNGISSHIGQSTHFSSSIPDNPIRTEDSTKTEDPIRTEDSTKTEDPIRTENLIKTENPIKNKTARDKLGLKRF